jgi:hypothetical protein
MEAVEHTLYICRQVNLYKIPPKATAGGHKSAEWLVADKIFEGRLRLIAKGELCEIRLEDPSSGELFALVPIPLGQRDICVEPVADSSRYFVLRVEDPTTKRHAFLGLGFNERNEAFDFNVALSDHERQVQRAKEVKVAATTASTGNQDALPATDAGLLYKKQDLSLKEGQTIKINVKKPGGAEGGGFLSGLASTSNTGSTLPTLTPLAPPPSTTTSQAPQQRQHATADPFAGADLLGLGGNFSSNQSQQSQPKPPTASGTDSWATF